MAGSALAESVLDYLSLEYDADGRPTVVVSGANVVVRSGPTFPQNGLGNVFIGPAQAESAHNNRSVHNLVLGHGHVLLNAQENLVMGRDHQVIAHGTLISGSGAKAFDTSYSGILGGQGSQIFSADWAAVCGGRLNTVEGDWSTAAGGYQNSLKGPYNYAGGGNHNVSSGSLCAMVGGIGARCGGAWATTVGGIQPTATERFQTRIHDGRLHFLTAPTP